MRCKAILWNMSVLAAFLAAGCSGPGSYLATIGSGSALPASTTSPALLLPAAEPEGPELHTFDLPSLGRWPLSFGGRGPVYVLAQLSPYVAQLGVLAEARRASTSARDGGCRLLGNRRPEDELVGSSKRLRSTPRSACSLLCSGANEVPLANQLQCLRALYPSRASTLGRNSIHSFVDLSSSVRSGSAESYQRTRK